MADTLYVVRGLRKIWIPEQGNWLYVWCHNDGELDRNCLLTYSVVSSPSEFRPALGNFILVPDAVAGDGSYNYVYGVPEGLYSSNGAVKLEYYDLGSALGWPRQTSQDQSAADGPSKSPNFGTTLEGVFSHSSIIDSGPILWSMKTELIHKVGGAVLEVTDIADVAGFSDLNAPTGTLVVSFQRDGAGQVLQDSGGNQLFNPIHDDSFYNDGSQFKAQNFKIGYLALTFVEDYFGPGIHGWVGGGLTSPPPFTVTLTAGADNQYTVNIVPGTLNGLLPSNIFGPPVTLTISDDITISYVKLSCVTDGKSPNAITVTADTTPVDPTTLVAQDTAPLAFAVTLAVLKGSTVHQIITDNLQYLPEVAFLTSQTATTAGQEPYVRWWTWVKQ